MKSVRIETGGSISVVEVPVPAAGPGEALLQTRAAGICGSDLIDWYVAKKAGQVIGHEIAGEIIEVGAGVTSFKKGDRVAPHHHAPCLECGECRAGRFVHCTAWRSSRLDPGGMAEYVRIPAGNLARDTLKVPDGLTFEEASFIEPLATVVKAFRRGGFQAGESILVIGLGTVGTARRAARPREDAGRIAGADRVPFRIALAKEAGGGGRVRRGPGGDRGGRAPPLRRRGLRLRVRRAGKGGVVRAADDAVAPGGTLLVFTMTPPGEEVALPGHDLYFREVSRRAFLLLRTRRDARSALAPCLPPRRRRGPRHASISAREAPRGVCAREGPRRIDEGHDQLRGGSDVS